MKRHIKSLPAAGAGPGPLRRGAPDTKSQTHAKGEGECLLNPNTILGTLNPNLVLGTRAHSLGRKTGQKKKKNSAPPDEELADVLHRREGLAGDHPQFPHQEFPIQDLPHGLGGPRCSCCFK